mmetsp:Transcript_68563/g.222125  ORF Transcript_68563/g.222125 Transcript_68563/m.222125 type:complete len:456 (-) Transcript_68563:270-1637(-)
MLAGFGLKLPVWDKSGSSAAALPLPTPAEELRPLGGAASRRRLRHVAQVALRCIDLGASAVLQGYVLEIGAAGAEDVLERSETFWTQNPTWELVGGAVGRRQLPIFELRAVLAPAPSSPSASSASAFRAGAAADAGGEELGHRHVLWREVVCLQDLERLHCEDLSSLKGISPLAVPLVQIGREWFSTPSSSSAGGDAAGLPSAPAMEAPKRLPARPLKQITTSEICSHGDHVSAMLSRLRDLKARSASLREAMEEPVHRDGAPAALRLRGQRCTRSVAELRRALQERELSMASLRGQLHAARGRCEGGAAWCSEAAAEHGFFGRIAAARHGGRPDNERARREVHYRLQALRMQLRCRQMRMLHEICQVYPIENHGSYWTIRGLSVASIENLSRQDLREEESVSTALGFLAHLVATLVGVLAVPLRIDLRNPGAAVEVDSFSLRTRLIPMLRPRSV